MFDDWNLQLDCPYMNRLEYKTKNSDPEKYDTCISADPSKIFMHAKTVMVDKRILCLFDILQNSPDVLIKEPCNTLAVKEFWYSPIYIENETNFVRPLIKPQVY